jgi:hypothetical protein
LISPGRDSRSIVSMSETNNKAVLRACGKGHVGGPTVGGLLGNGRVSDGGVLGDSRKNHRPNRHIVSCGGIQSDHDIVTVSIRRKAGTGLVIGEAYIPVGAGDGHRQSQIGSVVSGGANADRIGFGAGLND